MTSLETSNFKVARAVDLKEQLIADPHYIFCSKATSYAINDSVIETPHESEVSMPSSLYDDMILGKKITASDSAMLIKKNIWTSGTVYDQYSSSDTSLLTKDFFVSIKSGSTYYTYKCISNNNGVPSVTSPSGTSTSIFQTLPDGYQWKYMASIAESEYLKFSTDSYMPIVPDANVKTAAVKGSVDVIHVVTQGSAYTNQLASAWVSGDIAYGSSSVTYRLPTSASNLGNFYQGCIIKMTSGAANGQYRRITGYAVSGVTKLITLESAFSVIPAVNDTYEIYPEVKVTGDGSETILCEARAILDSTTGLVQDIEVLVPGAGYRKATATILADASVSISQDAVLDPSVSPGNGHGYDIYNELNASRVGVSVQIANTEGGNVVAANDYRTIGILKNPQYQNLKVIIDQTGQIGTFTVDETVKQYKATVLQGSVTVNSANNLMSGANTSFIDNLSVADEILVSDGIHNWFTNVSSVSNNTSLQMSDHPAWANSACTLKLIKTVAEGKVANVTPGYIILNVVTKPFNSVDEKILGTSSSTTSLIALANSSNFTIDDRSVNSFLTFNQVDILEGTIQGGTFQQDEILVQNTATAVVHSIVDTANTDSIALIDVNGTFVTGVQAVGNTSGATFLPSNKYKGFITKNTGEFLYIQNVAPISRAANKSERIKLVLES